MGLVNEITPEGGHLDRALEYAEALASFPQDTMLADREAAIRGIGMPFADGLKLETALFELCFSSEDKVEGVRAFLEKRAANFPGR